MRGRVGMKIGLVGCNLELTHFLLDDDDAVRCALMVHCGEGVQRKISKWEMCIYELCLSI